MQDKLFRKVLVVGIFIFFIVMSVIPSYGKIDVATSRTTIYDGSLSGYVNDISMNPIEGARVRVYFHETYEEDYSDEDGYYYVTNIPICYCLKNATCSKEGYETEWVLLGIVEDTTYDFILTSNNHPPDAPIIDGPRVARPGTHEWTFNATDPDGDNVSYIIHWDDGNIEGWIGWYGSGEEITRSHTYDSYGDYAITASAKDIHGLEGPEGSINVIMPRNKNRIINFNSLFLRLFEQFPNLFPILQKILNIIL